MNELVILMRENPLGTFILFLATLWAIERMLSAAMNRNRPYLKCECDCSCCEEEDLEDLEEDEEKK